MVVKVSAWMMSVTMAAAMTAGVVAATHGAPASTITATAETTVTSAAAITTPTAVTTPTAELTTATRPVTLMTTPMLERFIRPTSPPASLDSIVSIIYNGNRRLSVDPCNCIAHITGGIDREATVIDLIRSTSAPAVLLDAGGFLREPVSAPDMARAECLLEVLRALKVAAVNIAVPDLGLGLPALQKLGETYEMPFTSANVLDEKGEKPIFEPYRVVPVQLINGKKVRLGIMGVTRQVADGVTSTPRARVTIADPVATIRRLMPEVKKNSDVVILMTYQKREDAEQLLRTLGPEAGIDLAISSEMTVGKQRDYYLANYRIVDGVPLASTWMEGRSTSHLMLDVRDTGTTVAANKLIEIEQFIAPRADITTMVATCKARPAAQ
jgi:2',3'-cyclic-nucleotide 2'-phosphodiesterase (5'-nucleotidase family)